MLFNVEVMRADIGDRGRLGSTNFGAESTPVSLHWPLIATIEGICILLCHIFSFNNAYISKLP